MWFCLQALDSPFVSHSSETGRLLGLCLCNNEDKIARFKDQSHASILPSYILSSYSSLAKASHNHIPNEAVEYLTHQESK